MYIVKALKAAPGRITPGEEIQWSINQVEFVADSCIKYYREHPSVFSILGGPSLGMPGVQGEFGIPIADGDGNLGVVECSGFRYGESGGETEIYPVSHTGKQATAYIDFNATGEAGMKVTIDGIDFQEADTAVPATGVWTNGASAANSATSLIAAINGLVMSGFYFSARADASGAGVWVTYDNPGADGNVDITTTSAANCTVQNSHGGEDGGVKEICYVKHVVSTQELLSGAIEIPMPFTPAGFHFSATNATGTPKYSTDKVTIEATPNRIKIDTDGATNLVNTDVVYLTVWS